MKGISGYSPEGLLFQLGKHILLDGFGIVIDLRKSHRCFLWDAASERQLLDLYGFFGSLPVGFNHPYLDNPKVQRDLLEAARAKVANSDVHSYLYAQFVAAFHRVMGLAPLERYFFIEGGAMAIENALKAAMDWKVRQNLNAGLGERGTQIVHFERAFHGRSGYTLSLTNTDSLKTAYFAKFPWPRVPAPWIDFSLPEPSRTADVLEKEEVAEAEIRELLQQRSADIAAIIIEPIQGEGGDRHFRGQWLQTLRRLCNEHQVLLIFDEIQTGFGTTGRNWCCEHFGVVPDLLAFGKKAQVCGVMAGPRLDLVPSNCFRLPGRLNSTWGGNLTDMVRSTCYLQIIEQEHLVQNARLLGAKFLAALQSLAQDEPIVTEVRGRGLMLAFSLPDQPTREKFYQGLFGLGLLAIRSGERSIRFRPALDLPEEAIGMAIKILREQCRNLRKSARVPVQAALA